MGWYYPPEVCDRPPFVWIQPKCRPSRIHGDQGKGQRVSGSRKRESQLDIGSDNERRRGSREILKHLRLRASYNMSETVLVARCQEKEAEMNEVEKRLKLLIEKIDTSTKRLPKRPSVNGDQV